MKLLFLLLATVPSLSIAKLILHLRNDKGSYSSRLDASSEQDITVKAKQQEELPLEKVKGTTPDTTRALYYDYYYNNANHPDYYYYNAHHPGPRHYNARGHGRFYGTFPHGGVGYQGWHYYDLDNINFDDEFENPIEGREDETYNGPGGNPIRNKRARNFYRDHDGGDGGGPPVDDEFGGEEPPVDDELGEEPPVDDELGEETNEEEDDEEEEEAGEEANDGDEVGTPAIIVRPQIQPGVTTESPPRDFEFQTPFVPAEDETSMVEVVDEVKDDMEKPKQQGENQGKAEMFPEVVDKPKKRGKMQGAQEQPQQQVAPAENEAMVEVVDEVEEVMEKPKIQGAQEKEEEQQQQQQQQQDADETPKQFAQEQEYVETPKKRKDAKDVFEN